MTAFSTNNCKATIVHIYLLTVQCLLYLHLNNKKIYTQSLSVFITMVFGMFFVLTWNYEHKQSSTETVENKSKVF